MLHYLNMKLKIATLSVITYLLFSAISAHAQASPPSTFHIISPAPGEVIVSNKVSVLVNVSQDFLLGKDGYIFLWLDTLERTPENARITSEIQYIFDNVPSGLHTLYGELVRAGQSSFEPKSEVKVEFETIDEEIKPVATSADTGNEAPPEANGGLFIPPGKSNATIVIILIILAVAILWYVFGRSSKKTS